jgi:hypothetical protein
MLAVERADPAVVWREEEAAKARARVGRDEAWREEDRQIEAEQTAAWLADDGSAGAFPFSFESAFVIELARLFSGRSSPQADCAIPTRNR